MVNRIFVSIYIYIYVLKKLEIRYTAERTDNKTVPTWFLKLHNMYRIDHFETNCTLHIRWSIIARNWAHLCRWDQFIQYSRSWALFGPRGLLVPEESGERFDKPLLVYHDDGPPEWPSWEFSPCSDTPWFWSEHLQNLVATKMVMRAKTYRRVS